MGWLFMFVMVLLIPLSMIIIGKRAMNYDVKAKIDISKYRRKGKIKGEKERLYLSGYRTSRSMKNDETFKFAQKIFGLWWYRLGLIVIFPSAISMFFVLDKSKDVIASLGLFIVILQIIIMILPYFPVENSLKKNFDKNGNKIL